MADPARAGRCLLVPAGGTRVQSLPAERIDEGWRYATPQQAASEVVASEATCSSQRRIAELGRCGAGLARRCTAHRDGTTRSGWLPAGRRTWNWGLCLLRPRRWRDRATARNRFRRGTLLHALLQYLPDMPAEQRAGAALSWLDRPSNGLAAGEAEALAQEIMATP